MLIRGGRSVRENVRTDEESSAFLGDIVHDVEDAEGSSIGELIVNEVEGPACVPLRFCKDRRTGCLSPAAGPTLTDNEPSPDRTVDPVDPGQLPLPPQQDEKPAISEPAAFIGQLANRAEAHSCACTLKMHICKASHWLASHFIKADSIQGCIRTCCYPTALW